MLKRSDLGSHFVPDGRAEDGVVDAFLGAGRDHAHDIDRTQDRDGRILAGLDQRDGLGDDLVLELLALFVDHDELGDEHPRLAGPVHDLVVEVVDRAAALAREFDGAGSAAA